MLKAVGTAALDVRSNLVAFRKRKHTEKKEFVKLF